VKTTDVSRFSVWILVALIGLVVAACDDEKTPEEVINGLTGPLTVSSLISDPKVGVPGDTLLFTAVITSGAPNEGDYPVLEWTADGGAFLEDDKQTVRWVAPNESGIFTITAKATNAVNSSTNQASVFIGAGQSLVTEFAGQVDLIGGGPDFRYFYTLDFTRGVDVHQVIGGAESDPIDAPATNILFPQQNTVYSSDGLMEAHAADTVQFATTIRPRHIYVGTFASNSYTRLTVDGAKPGLPERNRFDQPAFSPNNQVVAYQRWAQAWDITASDSFHVYTHDIVNQKRTLVTYEHDFPRAFFPTFSTDGNWLVYIVDRARNGQWEVYGSPMTGNDVDGSLAALKKFTSTGGLIVTGAPRDLRRPPMTWNPVSPTLALAAADNVLYMIQTTASGANTIAVPEVFRAQEIVWAANGSLLAACFVVTDQEGDSFFHLATVTPAGVFADRFVAPEGDNLRDLAFSPDANWLLYRTTRGGGSWFSVLDIGGAGLTSPVAVTATDPAGRAADYRNIMSLRPSWTSANQMIYLSFTGNTSSTPGIFSRDLSGLVD